MLWAFVIVAGVAGLGFGVWLGYRWGERIRRGRTPRRSWWLAAIASWVGGFAVTFAGMVSGELPVQIMGVSLVVGLLTGLKYGGAEFAHVFRAPRG